ncbi:hypothetical protein ACL02O_11620 [Micromonospora sp. MS34]|uniref:hypothetical protein n=1 Tax=Micromonospora sp. MS34 TaxID=3385971 RepID=UPI00399F97A1
MNLRLTGGAMHVWSDLDGGHGPGPVRGAVLAPLLATATGRTLVAGPLDPALLEAVPADELTVLVRGMADAEALAARHPKMSLLCGGPEELAGGPRYDTVVALDGLGRLCSVEGAELGWAETFELLASAVRPGGRLLLAVENFVGLHRLLALPPEPTDTDWSAAGEYDPTRPAGLARVRARLAAAGLAPARTWAAWPSPVAPTVLLGPELLDDEAALGFLQATLGRAGARPGALLADPGRLVAGALRHGVAADLAPAWILLAERPADPPAGPDRCLPAPTAAGPETPRSGEELPAALLGVDADLVTVTGDPVGGWTRHRGGGRAVPSGRTLEDLVLAAALRRDLPAMRKLLRDWQSGVDAGVPADQVVGPPGAGGALTPPGEPMAALRRLAARMLDGGLAHLWPSPADPAELAVTLAVFAGRGAEPVPPPEAVPDRPDARAHRELLMERDRLARELAEARAQHEWYQRTLAEREAALKRARRIVAVLSATPTGRAGKALLARVRTARRTARAAMRRSRPD